MEIPMDGNAETAARQALEEVRQEAGAAQPAPGRARAALERFASYIAHAGQPAVTAAFMALAAHLGINPTR
jgi:hypothetical protein